MSTYRISYCGLTDWIGFSSTRLATITDMGNATPNAGLVGLVLPSPIPGAWPCIFETFHAPFRKITTSPEIIIGQDTIHSRLLQVQAALRWTIRNSMGQIKNVCPQRTHQPSSSVTAQLFCHLLHVYGGKQLRQSSICQGLRIGREHGKSAASTARACSKRH